MRLKWGHLCKAVRGHKPLVSLGGIIAGFDLPETGGRSLGGVHVVLAIEASASEARRGQRLGVELMNAGCESLYSYDGFPMEWRSLGSGYAPIRTIAFQIRDDWVLTEPGPYAIVARVDGEPIDGAIEFHLMPPSGSLDESSRIATAPNGFRVDWAHLCLEPPREPWLIDISDYYPTTTDRKITLSASLVALMTFGYEEGPTHWWRADVTGPDGEVIAPLRPGLFELETFGPGQPFRKMMNAPFVGLSLPGVGDYAFQIYLDHEHAFSLEYPVISVPELPPGWAARSKG